MHFLKMYKNKQNKQKIHKQPEPGIFGSGFNIVIKVLFTMTLKCNSHTITSTNLTCAI